LIRILSSFKETNTSLQKVTRKHKHYVIVLLVKLFH